MKSATSKMKSTTPKMNFGWLLEKIYGRFIDSNDGRVAMVVNDDRHISDRRREAQLKTLFKKHGVTLRFVP